MWVGGWVGGWVTWRAGPSPAAVALVLLISLNKTLAVPTRMGEEREGRRKPLAWVGGWVGKVDEWISE